MIDERVEHPGRVAPAADARYYYVRQAAEFGDTLPFCFLADDGLEVADHRRERVRPDHAPDDVVRVLDAAHPLAHGLVGRVLQGLASALDREHLGPHRPHAEHVQFLPADVLGAHVDAAGEAEQRRGGGGGDAVHPGPGFGDHAALAHALRDERLAESVVDLVRPGVVQVLAFEVDARPAGALGQPLGEVQAARPADVVVQQPLELAVEFRIRLGFAVGTVELVEREHERFGHVPPAVRAEPAAGVGDV